MFLFAALRLRRVDLGIVEIPIADDLHVLLGGQQVAAGRNLADPFEERPVLVEIDVRDLKERFVVPTGRHAGGKQRLGLGRQVERVADLGVVERLDAKAIARGEERAVRLVPEDNGELAAQLFQRAGAVIFVEVQSDFAVAVRAQACARGPSARCGSVRSRRTRH